MGPNSFRNLTYAAVMAVVGILGYLIYQSGQKQKAKRAAELAQSAELTSGIGGLSDTLGSLTTSTTAALSSGAAAAGAAASNAVSGSLISPAASAATSSSDVKNVTVEDVTSSASSVKSGVPSTSSKAAATGKKPQSPATKKPVVKFDAGSGGEFMAMAGAFASKDNADALVTKLKKLGFTKAEVVKLENSANVNVVAGYYTFKGGADAAVRTLKANKIDGFIRKKSGEIFKATPAAVAPVKPATKPAAKPAAPKPS
jgi:SPOR domain